MADENPETADEPGRRMPLEERVNADKRQFLKLVLGSMAAYSVPLMASFSMDGLRIGVAEAQNLFLPPGTDVANQLVPEGGTPLPRPPGPAFHGAPAEPFASNQPPPGEPFIFMP